MTNELMQYLNEMKAQIQELYEDIDSELRGTDNPDLILDGYNNVTEKLGEAMNNLESMISDLDMGVYNKIDSLDLDDEMLEVED